MEAADQGSHHMAVRGVVVITGPIEIGGHQADRIKAVLPAQRLTQLDASDLGDRIPLISGLQGPGEQRFLANRLLG
jgi:hypothetical protein